MASRIQDASQDTNRHFSARGKFLFLGEQKLHIRGVTYGTFRPDEQGAQFPAPAVVEADFAQMAAAGINAVRVYTPPPLWLLDLASRHDLHVMVGLPWEQHIVFLDQRGVAAGIEQRVRSAVRESAGHPAVLCYVVGNEIPATIVRWHGSRRIERFIKRLYDAVKKEAPHRLVTYVNYPTTEYLSLPFLDFLCFNVYLESPEKLEAYLAQLQNLAGNRPLVMAEVGLDSQRNGERLQAETMTWQIRTIFAAGCAGMFVFAWTDEWYRGGYDIPDWDFGLTRRDRSPKPALTAVSSAFAQLPFPTDIEWPRISVVVCTYNGARTLKNCLDGIARLEYPNYEVIVVDDGSTDNSAEIARQYAVKLIQTDNQGLSAARNTGMEAADGSIVAYTDDDASPDPHWLHYLAWTYLTTDYTAVGGPNIPPADDGPIAECVAHAPGGPVHVMVTHRDAEHIPGCNLSFRRNDLKALGGFDPRFKTAGDDVDICWRLLEQGKKIGFHSGAFVWHHRRDSIGQYWKQQKGYGRAEALLQEKWPWKYNAVGQIAWTGRLYVNGLSRVFERWSIYHGVWGSALFQRLYSSGPNTLATLVKAPEWYVLNLALAVVVLLSLKWPALQLAAIPLSISAILPLVYITRSVAGVAFVHDELRYRLLAGVLHMTQPLARLSGRVSHHSFGSKRRRAAQWSIPRRQVLRIWSERWKAPEEWLRAVETMLLADGLNVRRGGDWESWDLETRRGRAGAVRLRMAVEDHGAGKQMLLFHLCPRASRQSVIAAVVLGFAAAAAFLAQAMSYRFTFTVLFMLVVYGITRHCGAATAAAKSAVESLNPRVPAHDTGVTRVAESGQW